MVRRKAKPQRQKSRRRTPKDIFFRRCEDTPARALNKQWPGNYGGEGLKGDGCNNVYFSHATPPGPVPTPPIQHISFHGWAFMSFANVFFLPFLLLLLLQPSVTRIEATKEKTVARLPVVVVRYYCKPHRKDCDFCLTGRNCARSAKR